MGSNSHSGVAHVGENELETVGKILHGWVWLLHELVALSVGLCEQFTTGQESRKLTG